LKNLAFAGDVFSAVSRVNIEKKTEDRALREAFPRDARISCLSVDAELDVSARSEIVNKPAQFGGESQVD